MTTRPVYQQPGRKHCADCGLTYFSEGHHAEVCTGPPVFRDEPEYQRERAADDRDRRHEAYEDQRLTYPEKGLIE